MKRNTLLLLASFTSIFAVVGAVTVVASQDKQYYYAFSQPEAIARQIVLTDQETKANGGGNYGGWDHKEFVFNATTPTGSSFTPSGGLHYQGDGSVAVKYDGHIFRASFDVLYLTLDFTLRNIVSPTSVVLEGSFTNGSGTVSELSFTNFVDNGDNVYTLSINTNGQGYTSLVCDRILVNYNC